MLEFRVPGSDVGRAVVVLVPDGLREDIEDTLSADVGRI